MGKKSKQRDRGGAGAKPAKSVVAVQELNGRRARVLFAIGDADLAYTEGKIWRLAKRLKEQIGWNVVAASHDREALESARKLMLDVEYIPIESPGVTVEERLRATDEMIRETADIHIPGSQLPLWKVLAMDDFLSSLQLFGAQPSYPLEADAIIVPMMAIDNNTRASSGLYTWLISEGRRRKIPVIGLEISPLGNKNTLSHLPVDHYAVKNEWSKEFLVRQGLAQPERVSVLRWEESYCSWSGTDEFTDAFLELETTAREMLVIPQDRFTILIPHHVAFLWEVRKILEALAQVELPMSVVIRVDSRTTRRQYHERELVMETYGKEIQALPHVVIDERVGIGILLQLADLVISPFAGTTTERAALCRKRTIICQAMGEEGEQGEFLYWEPTPEKIPGLIRSWKEKGWLEQTRLAQIVQAIISRTARIAA
ncbi:MAG: hypothetical protein HYU46_19025 [Deltaproteobacteria bacterium]|nr:hypothetical protein [Deltaproteobacteria bacterium]MBI2364593.1 hypothetical protein [Deltaproteobacteria bacterium]MBI3066872.1 hypothetical protein [Deltaproteobacteria bacterium]